MLATSASSAIAQNLDEFAVRGETLAGADRLAAELRGRLDGPGQRGFDIGMGVAEGHTAPGPGKQRIHDSLPADQRAGFASAVLFSITRNANAAAANVGARIADGDAQLAAARRLDGDPFYALGFDIATGLLDERGGQVGFSTGLNAISVHGSLSGPARLGFEASAQLYGRSYALPSKSPAIPAPASPAGDYTTTDGTGSVIRVGSVPSVAGMTDKQAWQTLYDAGYRGVYVEANTGPILPPYDRVLGTRPVTGTTLPQKSEVQYLLPRAWVSRGDGRLTTEDEDTRLGFDLDTGKYVRVDDGADIYATSYVSVSDGGRRKIKHLRINIAPTATMVKAGVPSWAIGGPGSLLQTLGHHQSYQDCERSFLNLTPNPAWSGREQYCILTDGGRTARVQVAEDESFFTYALFAGKASTAVKPVGRIYGPDGLPAKSQLTICESAKVARDRNSPAAPGLAQKCLASGGTVPQ